MSHPLSGEPVLAIALILALAFVGMPRAAQAESNPLLAEWEGPYGGLPAFDTVKLEDLKSGLEIGMERSLAELEVIAQQDAAPTFENTIVAMETSGQDLDRLFNYYGIWASNMSSPEFREIQREMAPKLSAYSSAITQNEALFLRVREVYKGTEYATLRDDQKRVAWLTYNQFARNGAELEGADKERYAAINARLAELHTSFSNNVLNDEESYAVFLNEDQLGGLSDSYIAGAASAAEERGESGKYAVTNSRSSMDPFLTFSTERDLREKVWNNYYSRGDNGGEFDNNAIIAEILQLRHERVGLLGYENYSSWRLEDRMAKNPDNAMNLLMEVWPVAVSRVHEEVADMQALADAEGADIKIAPWDYRFYAEKVRRDRYDLDSDEVKQYMQADQLILAMHDVADKLFGFTFTELPEGKVPVFHPDVRVWEVTSSETGDHIGLWYLDAYGRKGKRSGAWATMYRSQQDLYGPGNVLCSNNSNFMAGQPGEPVLVSWADATTFFHEFGHALHFLASDIVYPTLGGGVRDYTEFQSQLLERWLSTDLVIDKYLVHHETGESIPAELVAKVKKAATFNEGFRTVEYLASAIMDLKYHTTDPAGLDPDTFERETLTEMGMPSELVMRHRSPHFGHVFSGEGYSSGYYGYMWADVLTSDAAEAFAEAPGGFYDGEVAARLVKYLFAPRNALDPAEAYRSFRGRDAQIDALMRDKGFAPKATTGK